MSVKLSWGADERTIKLPANTPVPLGRALLALHPQAAQVSRYAVCVGLAATVVHGYEISFRCRVQCTAELVSRNPLQVTARRVCSLNTECISFRFALQVEVVGKGSVNPTIIRRASEGNKVLELRNGVRHSCCLVASAACKTAFLYSQAKEPLYFCATPFRF
jgi:hypothetical protein